MEVAETKTGVRSRRVAKKETIDIAQRGVPTAKVSHKAGLPGDDSSRNESDRRIGGCLRRKWQAWASLSSDPWVTQVLREGYRIPFVSQPNLSESPIALISYTTDPVKTQALQEEIDKMLYKGAIEPVVGPLEGLYNRMFLADKASGGFRPVIDLRRLNSFIRTDKFAMETSQSVRLAVRPEDWMASVDLKDAYFQIPMHPESRRFLRFVWKGTPFQFKTVCFGLSTAPSVFTRVFAVLAAHAHRQGIRVVRYLDD